MKKIIIPMLTLVMLAGCSKSEPEPLENRALISLGAGVNLAKAPIVEGNTVNAGIAGWEAATADYSAAPTWNTDITTTANPTDAQAVTFAAPQYYSADAATKTFMKAWYPKGSLTGTAVAFENTDGSVDPLFAPVISGSKADKAAKTLAFAHKTAQLKFQVMAGTGLASDVTITSITVKEAQLPVGFNLETDAVAYAAAADLKVLENGSVPIVSNATGVGNTVMIKPITGKTFKVDVVTNKDTYTDQTVTVETDNVSEGFAYTITLTFGQAGVTNNATVSDWQTSTGSGSFE